MGGRSLQQVQCRDAKEGLEIGDAAGFCQVLGRKPGSPKAFKWRNPGPSPPNMNTQLTFRIMGAALGIQLALGGLVTFDFLDPSVHIIWGIVLGILAVVNLVYVMRMPGRSRPVVGVSIGIGVDILVQALLGFAVLGTSSNADLSNGLAWVHFLNALAIFAMTLFGTFMAMAGARMSQARQTGPLTQ